VTFIKLIFVNRYFYPDHSATSQLLSDLVFFLAARGFRVEVVTSAQRYDDPAASLPDGERCRGVLIHRVRGLRFGRESLPGRLLDCLSFFWSAFLRLRQVVARGDCVVVKTDPPLISIPAALVARWRGAILINWLQDVFPEIATELGIMAAGGAMGRLTRAMRDWSLRRARINVVVGTRMASLCARRGIAREAIAYIPNWADELTIRPMAPDLNPLRMRWGLRDAFVVGYSGNLGRAHEFETLLGAAELLRAQPDLIFLFIGAGALMAALRQAVAVRGLRNFRFKPCQPRAGLSESLSVPDVHLVVLRPGFEGLMVPSKFYGVAAAGRAILYVGDREGEIPRLIAHAGAGWTIAPGESAALAAHILDLRDHRSECRAMGLNARRLVETRFPVGRALAAWAALLAPWKG